MKLIPQKSVFVTPQKWQTVKRQKHRITEAENNLMSASSKMY